MNNRKRKMLKKNFCNEVARFKTAVHNKILKIEKDTSNEIKRFTGKLVVKAANAVPAMQNVILDEAVSVEKKN